jgi:hypothetical protein
MYIILEHGDRPDPRTLHVVSPHTSVRYHITDFENWNLLTVVTILRKQIVQLMRLFPQPQLIPKNWGRNKSKCLNWKPRSLILTE